LPDQVRNEVDALFGFVEQGPEPSDLFAPGITVGIRPGELFSLVGDGYRALQGLTETLARPALSEGGLSLKAAESLLLSACSTFVQKGADAALRWLQDTLDRPPDGWTVIRPVSAFVPNDYLEVGMCRVQRGLPPSPVGEWPESASSLFPGFSIATDVEAHDEESARLIAEQQFAEALAILGLSDNRRAGRDLLGRPSLLIHGAGVSLRRHGPSMFVRLGHGGGLWPHLEALSRAASKKEDDRTDWERRTLAAARWWAEASTPWPSDALAALMVALEVLFIEHMGIGAKGQTIAKLVAERWSLEPMSKEELEAWLTGLYNDATRRCTRAGTTRTISMWLGSRMWFGGPSLGPPGTWRTRTLGSTEPARPGRKRSPYTLRTEGATPTTTHSALSQSRSQGPPPRGPAVPGPSVPR